MVKAIKWWEKQERSYPLVRFPQKIWKKVPKINNDGEHTGKNEDGVSLLQLFSYYHKADSRITCTTYF